MRTASRINLLAAGLLSALGVGPVTTGAAEPELPRNYVDTTYVPPTGATPSATLRTGLTVAAGGDFQAALDAAQPGDVITLEAGATYTGPFILPHKTGSAWITVQTSAFDQLPPPGTRITPAQADLLPKLTAPAGGNVLATAPGAHHYRFVGLEIHPLPGQFIYAPVQLGDHPDPNTAETIPHHFIFDRVYVHGDPKVGGRRGFVVNSGDTAVLDSYVSDFKEEGADTQAIEGWNGPGPFKIVNNTLEAAGENVMFGGARASITGLTPSDIEIRHNYFFKPRRWRVGDPTYEGTLWTVKNLLELKHAQRVLIEGNVFDQNWAGQGQGGFALVLTVRGEETMTWAPVQDVTFTHNLVRNSSQGIAISGHDDGPSAEGRRMLFRDNLWRLDSPQWGAPGANRNFLEIANGAADIALDHNTIDHVAAGAILWGQGRNERFIFRNNLIGHGSYGVTGTGGVGNGTLESVFPEVDFRKNAIWREGEGDPAWYSHYPDNFWPATIQEVGFVDRAGGDYRLAATSPYRNAGTDGKDLGADMEAINAATAGVISGSLPVSHPETFNRTFYVDAANGHDDRDGLSLDNAWQTLSKANATVQPGDLVFLRGTFENQYIRPQASGTAAQPITFKSRPGEAAILAGGQYGTNVWLDGRSFLIVEGLILRDSGSEGVCLRDGAHHLILRNNTLERTSIHIVQGSDNLIENNTIREVGSEADNAGDAIAVANGSCRNRILSNTLTHAGHMLIGIGGSQAEDAECLDNVIAHNRLSNPWAGNIGLTWKARRTLIEYNRMSDGGTSPTSVSPSRTGIQTYARENIIRYNEICNNAEMGIHVSSYTYGTAITQDAIGNQIYHNVIYGNGKWGLFIQEKHGRFCRDNLIANNIFFRNQGFPWQGSTYTIALDHYHNPTDWPAGRLNGNRFLNNIILREPGTAGEKVVIHIRNANLGGNLYYTLTEFQAAYPEAQGNLEVDPLFVNEEAGDFHLQPGSPALDQGLALVGLPYQGAAPDIGAYEAGASR